MAKKKAVSLNSRKVSKGHYFTVEDYQNEKSGEVL